MDKRIVDNIKCPFCERCYKTKTTLNIHLQKVHVYSKQEAKDICNKLNVITESEMLSKENVKKTCIKKYGTTNAGGVDSTQEKIKQTNMERYGVEYSFQSDNIKEKIKQTNMERYGVDNPRKSDVIKRKIEQTCLEKYGYKCHLASPEIQRKIENTNLETRGVKRPCQDEDGLAQLKTTQFSKYGRWFAQTDEHHKSNYQWKDYTFPSGNIIRIQGYENLALNILLNTYKECDLITSTKVITNLSREFWYEFDNSSHRYYPDIYIPLENLIIEVKSEYTYSQQGNKNQAKRRSCESLGYNFEFWVFNTDDMLKKIL